jgi:hypothetical protein
MWGGGTAHQWKHRRLVSAEAWPVARARGGWAPAASQNGSASRARSAAGSATNILYCSVGPIIAFFIDAEMRPHGGSATRWIQSRSLGAFGSVPETNRYNLALEDVNPLPLSHREKITKLTNSRPDAVEGLTPL